MIFAPERAKLVPLVSNQIYKNHAEMQLRILWQQIVKKFEEIELIEPPTGLKPSIVSGYTLK